MYANFGICATMALLGWGRGVLNVFFFQRNRTLVFLVIQEMRCLGGVFSLPFSLRGKCFQQIKSRVELTDTPTTEILTGVVYFAGQHDG